MRRRNLLKAFGAAATGLAMPSIARAQAATIKVGLINSFTGPAAAFGEMNDKAVRLYLKLNERELGGARIELLNRDDGGPNPDRARQLAQELVVRDRVNILMGATFTPNALAIAPIATEARIPFVITNAATSIITQRSDFIVRFSMTLLQSVTPLGTWAARQGRTAYTMISDYAPGIDAEQGFTRAFTAGGGTIAGSVRMPIQTADFAPFMQRAKDANPNFVMVFVPAGTTSSGVMRAFTQLGLPQANIKLIGPGDLVPEEELVNMGDVALGVNTVFHYSAAGDRPANRAFVEAWHREYGANSDPNFTACASWDSAAAIVRAVKEQNGQITTDRTMEILKNYSAESPRGPIRIDPATRDIVQNEYLREVRRVNGRLMNVEIETLATALRDPGKP